MKLSNRQLLVLSILIIIGGIVWLEGLQNKPSTQGEVLKMDEENYEIAPQMMGVGEWINTEPLLMEELRGKVVLIDFWTYSCINCIRTLPYLKAWHEQYSDQGLVIIGVHTPEFSFEKKVENLERALTRYNITYPILQDNEYTLWRRYNNRYWPRKYLIDTQGRIRYDHIGEGGYEETEDMIRKLLAERTDLDDELSDPIDIVPVNFRGIRTPEIYFGNKFYRGDIGGGLKSGTNTYKSPKSYSSNTAYLNGTWKTNDDYSELQDEVGEVILKYNARVVNIVAGSEANITVILDDEIITVPGEDVVEGIALIHEEKLYNIVSDEKYQERTLKLKIEGKGFRLYTFTFG